MVYIPSDSRPFKLTSSELILESNWGLHPADHIIFRSKHFYHRATTHRNLQHRLRRNQRVHADLLAETEQVRE